MSYLKNLLGENEQIVFVTRQHWLILLGQILAKSVLALGLVIVITLIWRIWLPQIAGGSSGLPFAHPALTGPVAGCYHLDEPAIYRH
jgi:hypothetical protein